MAVAAVSGGVAGDGGGAGHGRRCDRRGLRSVPRRLDYTASVRRPRAPRPGLGGGGLGISGRPGAQGSKHRATGRGAFAVPGYCRSFRPSARLGAGPRHGARPARWRARIRRSLHGPGGRSSAGPDVSARGRPTDERLADHRERAARAVGVGERPARRHGGVRGMDVPAYRHDAGVVLVPGSGDELLGARPGRAVRTARSARAVGWGSPFGPRFGRSGVYGPESMWPPRRPR